VLVTETFASGLIGEGILPTIEHAHEHLLTPNAAIIPTAATVMGYLAGGPQLKGMLFVDDIAGFDFADFNDFAPPSLVANLDSVPHEILSDDTALLRFDLTEKRFAMASSRRIIRSTRQGLSAGVAQWIRLDLDARTRYENRPLPGADFNGHWAHILYRFPRLLAVEPGAPVPVIVRHDRSQLGIDLAE
jgi:hypothetical protein